MRAIAAALLLLLPAAETPDPPVEQTKKNIKVLQGLPSSRYVRALPRAGMGIG